MTLYRLKSNFSPKATRNFIIIILYDESLTESDFEQLSQMEFSVLKVLDIKLKNIYDC